jgi:hypothetical protein
VILEFTEDQTPEDDVFSTAVLWFPDQQFSFVGENTNPTDPRFCVLMTNSDEEQNCSVGFYARRSPLWAGGKLLPEQMQFFQIFLTL